jgi:tRNA-dihydrouridine synthase
MIGRAAQGRPWIFAEINQYLNPSSKKRVKSNTKTPWHFTTGQKNLILEHLELIHRYYDRFETENLLHKSIKQSTINKDQAVDLAVKISRKHVCWYFNQMVQCFSNLMKEHASDFSVATSSCLVAENQAIRKIKIAKKQFNTLLVAKDQLQFLKQFFSETNLIEDIAA